MICPLTVHLAEMIILNINAIIKKAVEPESIKDAYQMLKELVEHKGRFNLGNGGWEDFWDRHPDWITTLGKSGTAEAREAPGHFLTIMQNAIIVDLNYGMEMGVDAIWAKHLHTMWNIKGPDYIHKFGFTVDKLLNRDNGVADIVGFCLISNWEPLQTMTGKKIVTLNQDVDQFLGHHLFMAWTALRDLQYDVQLKLHFDMWRLVYLGSELNGVGPGRRKA